LTTKETPVGIGIHFGVQTALPDQKEESSSSSSSSSSQNNTNGEFVLFEPMILWVNHGSGIRKCCRMDENMKDQ
jgi:hypothetical protein